MYTLVLHYRASLALRLLSVFQCCTLKNMQESQGVKITLATPMWNHNYQAWALYHVVIDLLSTYIIDLIMNMRLKAVTLMELVWSETRT